jgi:hypothetical protein
MKLALTTASLQVAGHLGPTCMDEEVQITACGRCQSRNSIVVAPVD